MCLSPQCAFGVRRRFVPRHGSNGDGARLAEKLGHTIIPMRPSLVALTSDDEDCPAMQGLSLRNCGVTVTDNEKKKKPVYTDFGELLFTHFGFPARRF